MNENELRCSGRVGSSCSTSDTLRATIVRMQDDKEKR